MLYTHKDVTTYILSYLSNSDRFHFIISCTFLYKTYKNTLDPSVNDNEPIRKACEFGYVEQVMQLLKDPRVDPSVNNNTCIRISAMKGYDNIVRALLQHPRVDPSVNNNKALAVAISNGHTTIVELLLKDPRVDPVTSRALEKAIFYRKIDIIKLLLLDSRIDPAIYDNYLLSTECLSYMITKDPIQRQIIKALAVVPTVINSKSYNRIYDTYLSWLI